MIELPKQNFKSFRLSVPSLVRIFYIITQKLCLYYGNQECFPVLISQVEKCLDPICIVSLYQDKTQITKSSPFYALWFLHAWEPHKSVGSLDAWRTRTESMLYSRLAAQFRHKLKNLGD